MNIMGTDVLEKKKKQTTLDVGNKKIGFALIIEEKEEIKGGDIYNEKDNRSRIWNKR